MGLLWQIPFWTIVLHTEERYEAVVPGFINYNYEDGIPSGHTAPYFNKFNILVMTEYS